MDFQELRDELYPELAKLGGNITRTRLYINRNIDLANKLTKSLEEYPEYQTILKIALAIYNKFELPRCIICSKCLRYKQYEQKQQFCSRECVLKSSEPLKKRENTMLKKYGSKNASNVQEFCIKREETNLKKFGSRSSLGNKDIQAKCKDTLIKKYGFDNASKVPSIKKKIELTNIERYGFKSPFQNEDVKKKIGDTNFNRYGVRCILSDTDMRESGMYFKYGYCHPMRSPEIRQRVKDNLLAKYGVTHNTFIPGVREKIENTCLERFGTKTPLENASVRLKSKISQKTNLWYSNYQPKIKKLLRKKIKTLTTFEEYLNNDRFRYFNFQCTKCNQTFTSYITSYRCKFLPSCPFCNPLGHISEQENYLVEYIKNTLEITNIVLNSRTLLDSGKELDIYLPDYNIGFEFDGLYWHSEACSKDKLYHLNKTQECEAKGIRLIHIFENEFCEKLLIVKDRIRNILGLTKYQIQPKNYEVYEINYDISKQFIDKYHLQGNCKSDISLGLYHKNRLVSVMTFGKPKLDKNIDWELLRYASISNFHIIDSSNILLDYFQNHYKGSIIGYSDKRWSTGNLYKKLGFQELEDSPPNCFYCKAQHLYNYSETMNNKDGYYRIWDCGSKVFIKE